MTVVATLAFLSPGLFEIMVIGVVALLVFGGNLPDVMRNVGRAYAKFRQGLQDVSKPVREELRQVRELPQTAPMPEYDEDDRQNEGDEDLYAPDTSEYEAPPESESGPAEEEARARTESPDDDDEDVYGAADEPPPV